jgi:hypothetical protein
MSTLHIIVSGSLRRTKSEVFACVTNAEVPHTENYLDDVHFLHSLFYRMYIDQKHAVLIVTQIVIRLLS